MYLSVSRLDSTPTLSLSLSHTHKAKLLEWLTLLALKFWKTFSASIHFFASNYTQTHSRTQLLALVCGWWWVWYREPCAIQQLHSSFSLTLFAYIQKKKNLFINILIALLLEFNTSNTHVSVSIIVPSQYTYKWYHCSPFEENSIPPLLLVSSLCVPLPP